MSKIFSLTLSDWQKSLVMAVLTPVVGYVYQIVSAGSFELDWSYLAKLALSGLLGYVLKNFLSDKDGKVLGRIG